MTLKPISVLTKNFLIYLHTKFSTILQRQTTSFTQLELRILMKKPKVTPTNVEVKMNEKDLIVSKTDTRGVITYCNDIFMLLAKYKESDLIDKNHNIIRHPDMPRVAFKLAWELISSGDEFFGFVKNLSADGSYYWVFANITPDYDDGGTIIGYTSIRRKPSATALETIIPLYKELQRLESSSGMEASKKYLVDLLESKNLSYNELVLSLQGVK